MVHNHKEPDIQSVIGPNPKNLLMKNFTMTRTETTDKNSGHEPNRLVRTKILDKFLGPLGQEFCFNYENDDSWIVNHNSQWIPVSNKFLQKQDHICLNPATVIWTPATAFLLMHCCLLLIRHCCYSDEKLKIWSLQFARDIVRIARPDLKCSWAVLGRERND